MSERSDGVPALLPGVRVDALFAGTAFVDVVLAGLPHLPVAGTEVWAARRRLSPGGVATQAVAAARLGLHSALVAAVGTDPLGDLLWAELAGEPGLDLRWARRVEGLQTPLTVALSHDADRSFVSHGVLDPVPVEELVDTLPTARACFVSLEGGVPPWLRAQRTAGALVVAGVGWDPAHAWSRHVLDALADVDVFVPNAGEAMAYTRTGTPREALRALAGRVPLVVVTCGADGALALDASTGEEVAVPAARVEAVDPTGAGDVFTAALVAATLEGRPLAGRLAFAAACAGLAVQDLGGAASAPTLEQVSRLAPAPHDPGPAVPAGPVPPPRGTRAGGPRSDVNRS